MLSLPKVEKWKDNPSPHGDYNSVAISADGSKVVAGTFYYNDGTSLPTQTVGMFGWDSNGTQLWQPDTYSVTAAPYARAGVESVAISKDGSWAASGGLISPGVGFLHVYDSAGTKTSLLNPPSTVRSVALSSDGSYLVAGADVLYVFKRTGSAWGAPVTVADPAGIVRRVAIADDGGWIAAAIDGGWTSLVRNQIGTGGTVTAEGKWRVPLTPPDPQPFVQNVAVAADGSSYVAAGADGKTYYFDIDAFQTTAGALAPRWSFNPPGKSACRWVAISDDGSRVSTVFSFGGAAGVSTKGKTYLLRNIKNPPPAGPKYERLWTGDEHTAHGPNAVSMGKTSAGQYYVAVADGTPNPQSPDGGFYLFDGNDGNSLWGGPPDHNFPTSRMNYCVAMAADGTAIVGGSNDGYVYYFMVP
jgi:WD40 repeat protein